MSWGGLPISGCPQEPVPRGLELKPRSSAPRWFAICQRHQGPGEERRGVPAGCDVPGVLILPAGELPPPIRRRRARGMLAALQPAACTLGGSPAPNPARLRTGAVLSPSTAPSPGGEEDVRKEGAGRHQAPAVPCGCEHARGAVHTSGHSTRGWGIAAGGGQLLATRLLNPAAQQCCWGPGAPPLSPQPPPWVCLGAALRPLPIPAVSQLCPCRVPAGGSAAARGSCEHALLRGAWAVTSPVVTALPAPGSPRGPGSASRCPSPARR